MFSVAACKWKKGPWDHQPSFWNQNPQKIFQKVAEVRYGFCFPKAAWVTRFDIYSVFYWHSCLHIGICHFK